MILLWCELIGDVSIGVNNSVYALYILITFIMQEILNIIYTSIINFVLFWLPMLFIYLYTTKAFKITVSFNPLKLGYVNGFFPISSGFDSRGVKCEKDKGPHLLDHVGFILVVWYLTVYTAYVIPINVYKLTLM